MNLSSVLSARPLAPMKFQVEVPDGWQQGRGAFGGLVLGVLTDAMEQSRGDASWAARALNGEIMGPVLAGPAQIDVEVLRRGTGIETLSARLSQNGELLARASVAFGKSRVMDRERLSVQAPKPPHWETVEVAPVAPPFGPHFAQHFEFRPTSGLPFSGSKSAVTSGFIRPKEATRGPRAPELVACLDAWWPVLLNSEELPRPMGTLTSTVELCGEGPVDFRVPLFHRATEVISHAGFSVELRELWAGEKLIALNQQMFVIVK